MLTDLSPAAKALQIHEERTGLKVKTDRSFYDKVGISPKRFGLLIKGKLDITLTEAQRVSNVFSVPITDLL